MVELGHSGEMNYIKTQRQAVQLFKNLPKPHLTNQAETRGETSLVMQIYLWNKDIYFYIGTNNEQSLIIFLSETTK